MPVRIENAEKAVKAEKKEESEALMPGTIVNTEHKEEEFHL